jgi:hypothetical protein
MPYPANAGLDPKHRRMDPGDRHQIRKRGPNPGSSRGGSLRQISPFLMKARILVRYTVCLRFEYRGANISPFPTAIRGRHCQNGGCARSCRRKPGLANCRRSRRPLFAGLHDAAWALAATGRGKGCRSALPRDADCLRGPRFLCASWCRSSQPRARHVWLRGTPGRRAGSIDAFARLGAGHEFLPAPAGILASRTASLPPLLRHLRKDVPGGGGDGAIENRFSAGWGPRRSRSCGSRNTFALHKPRLESRRRSSAAAMDRNGTPIGEPDLRRQSAWTPDGAGFTRRSVTPAQGAIDSVLVRPE